LFGYAMQIPAPIEALDTFNRDVFPRGDGASRAAAGRTTADTVEFTPVAVTTPRAFAFDAAT
jgi:hypothetical protein